MKHHVHNPASEQTKVYPHSDDPLLDEELMEETAESNRFNTPSETVEDQAESPIKKLQDELSQLQKTVAEGQDKLIRAHADMANIRLRAQKDIENAHKYSLESFCKALLPVIDSLEKALETATEADRAHLEGIALTLKVFLDVLKKFGIEPIDPLHQPFDPLLHEAISTIPHEEVDTHTVLQVFQKGYTLNGRLIRPAKVIVSQ